MVLHSLVCTLTSFVVSQMAVTFEARPTNAVIQKKKKWLLHLCFEHWLERYGHVKD